MRPSEDCWECSCFVFCSRCRVEFRHLMRPSEERPAGTADFIVFCRCEQHFVVLCVYLRIVGGAECVDFYGG